MDFNILIDDLFMNIQTDPSLNPTTNKNILSLLNDYENEEWRYDKFQQFIWNNIAETALSYREREALIGLSATQLAEAAKKLRLTDKIDDISNGSELAEIILYGIMKHHFHALPVVPKIFYKQNPQDNAKGADSVHIILDDKDDFTIWFGEAKFYNSIEDSRLYEIIYSVKNSLHIEKLKKENSIVTELAEIDALITNIDLRDRIKKILSTRESIDNMKPKLHIPILLLHECEITKKYKNFTKEYRDEILEYHKDRANSYFKKQISLLSDKITQYSDITFHIILLPVPHKKIIVDKFLANVEFHKNQ